MSPKFLVLLLVVSVSAVVFEEDQYQFLFTKWVQQHQKNYEADAFFFRFNIWKANLDAIYLHNKGNHSYTLAMNAFGDLTPQEFIATHTGYRHIDMGYLRGLNTDGDLADVTPAASIDWRTKGAVTPVQDQGQCGSCWAFSATGSTEGAHFIAKAALVSLSEQQLMDCSTSQGNQGCNGGLMDYAFQYIIRNGITTEAAYPYKAVDGTCKSSGKPVAATIRSFKDVTPNNDAQLKAALTVGPVSIAIEADQSAFQFYSSGVFTGLCGANLDHGVLAVGYGTDSGNNYYIVKNSWGASWGEAGYIRLIDKSSLNGGSGQCGMLSAPSYPIV